MLEPDALAPPPAAYRVSRLKEALEATDDEKLNAEKVAKIREVLHINMEYQTFLREQIDKIEVLMGKNFEKKRIIDQVVEMSNRPSRRNTIPRKSVFGAPWFVDGKKNQPPPNPDTVRKIQHRGTIPRVHSFTKWSKEEMTSLKKAIQVQNQAILLKQVFDNFKKAKDEGMDMLEATALMNQENAKITGMSEEELQLNTSGIDWDVIAASYVRSRSGIDCMIQWMGNDDPRINKTAWNRDEDKKLLQLTEEYKGHNWVEIATRLNTNRTAMQCFMRYQRSLNPKLIRSKWSKEEDERLRELVIKYGERNWQDVSAEMDGRTDQQCLHRWTKSVDPNIRSGRWSYEEDLRLRLAVAAYGTKNWKQVQRHVPNRTDVKCRERWVNVLDPKLTKKPWTADEDEKLRKLAMQLGPGHWTEVAKQLTPRTDHQCWRRWKKLCDKDQLKKYQKNLNIKRNMVRNFVGRSKERTQLAPEDVEDIPMISVNVNGEEDKSMPHPIVAAVSQMPQLLAQHPMHGHVHGGVGAGVPPSPLVVMPVHPHEQHGHMGGQSLGGPMHAGAHAHQQALQAHQAALAVHVTGPPMGVPVGVHPSMHVHVAQHMGQPGGPGMHADDMGDEAGEDSDPQDEDEDDEDDPQVVLAMKPTRGKVIGMRKQAVMHESEKPAAKRRKKG